MEELEEKEPEYVESSRFLHKHFQTIASLHGEWYGRFEEYGDEDEDFILNLKKAVEDFDNTLSCFISEKFGYTP
jgi:hypothetical protein